MSGDDGGGRELRDPGRVSAPAAPAAKSPATPGKQTNTSRLAPPPAAPRAASPPSDPKATARAGVAGSGGPLPYLDKIRSSFGRHDVSGAQAHVGGAAASATGELGADAFTVGSDVAFGATPDLHTAAHEAAHVVQQRAGVNLAGGIGGAGDEYEREADDIADLVVRGQSAESLLDRAAQRRGNANSGVQLDDRSRRRRAHRGGTRDAPQEVRARHALAHLPDDATPEQLQAAINAELARPGHVHREDLIDEVRRRFPALERRVHVESDESIAASIASDDDGERVLSARGERAGRGGRTETYVAVDEDESSVALGARHIQERDAGPNEAPGTTPTTTASATATLGPGGPQLQASEEISTDLGDGVSQSSTRTGSIDGSGQVTVGGSSRRGAEGDQQHRGAELNVDTSLHGIQGVSGRVSWGRGRRTASLTGGFQIDIEEPQRQPDGTFRITGTLDMSAGVGGEDSTASSGPRARGTASIGYSGRRGFTRVFQTESEARQFYENTQRYFDLAGVSAFDIVGLPSSDDAASMAVGESRTQRDGIEGSAGGTATVGPAQVGATFTLGSNQQIVVTRSTPTAVRVRVTDTTTAGISGTAGAGGVGLRLGASGSSSTGAEYEFDLTPEGRAAYERATRGGTLPSGDSGRGWRLVSTQAGRTDADTHGVDMLVGGFTDTNETAIEDEVAADGARTRRYRGRSELEAQTVLPDELTEGTALGRAREEVQIEMTSRGETTYSADVQGSNAADAHRALSEITGAGSQPHLVDGAAAGTWHVQASLTDAQVQTLIENADQINVLDVGIAHAGDVQALQSALRRARADGVPRGRRMDIARRAIAEFVAETGSNGAGGIRAAIGERPRFDVSLEGSDTFTGDAGNTHLRTQIADLTRRMSLPTTDLTELTQEAQALVREQEGRLARMRNRDQFRELPNELRQEQINLLQPIVAELRRLAQRIAEAGRSAPQRAVAEQAEQRAELRAHDEGTAPESRPEDGVAVSDSTLRARADIERDADTMRETQIECRRVLETTRRERDLHYGRNVQVFIRPAVEGLYEESDAYERANQAWTQAQQKIGRAHQAQASYDQMWALVSGRQSLDTTEMQQAASETRVHTWDAARYYREATAQLRTAYRTYTSIRNRHRGERQYWGDHPPALPSSGGSGRDTSDGSGRPPGRD